MADTLDANFTLAFFLLGEYVRFQHQPESEPMRVTAMRHDGMVEVDKYPGWFAAHLFVLANAPR
jgi:hypothetical protein